RLNGRILRLMGRGLPSPQSRQGRASGWGAMGRDTLVLALFLPGLAIAAAQSRVPPANRPTVPRADTTQRSRATADASDASSGHWTLIGPQPLLYNNPYLSYGEGRQHSGQVNALAVDPRDPKVVYLGAEGGGVW